MSQPESVDQEDTRILVLTGQICSKLRINFAPVALVWAGTLGHPTHLPSDQVAYVTRGAKRGHLLVPSAVRGKLEPADWNFLLLSSLVYRFKPQFARVWKILTILLYGSFSVAIVSVPFMLPN